MRYRRTLRYEPLEDRRLLATVTVNTLADTIDLDRRPHVAPRSDLRHESCRRAGHDRRFRSDSSCPATVTLTQGELRITRRSHDSPVRVRLDSRSMPAGSDPTPDKNNGDGSRIFNVDDGRQHDLFIDVISGPDAHRRRRPRPAAVQFSAVKTSHSADAA